MKTLHLHLKFEYFDAIMIGEKKYEYRLASKWLNKLKKNKYDFISLYRGYQKVNKKTLLTVPYLGFHIEKIKHVHFGEKYVSVCALKIVI